MNRARERADSAEPKRVAVVGTGLMGASVGLAAKRAGVDWVGGHDADDAAAAAFRLGVNLEMSELIANLTPAQLLKMAASNMLLCRFRFDEHLLLNMIADYDKSRLMSEPHAAIMMAGQPVEAIAG